MKIESFLKNSLISRIQALELVLSRKLDDGLKRLDLTQLEALTLLALFSEESGSVVGPGRLSNALELPRARMSQVLTSLQNKNLVARESQKADSRRFRLVLSKVGRVKATEAMKIYHELDERFDGLVPKTLRGAILKWTAEAATQFKG